jgi:Flp pilus assembly protein TadB
MSGHSLESAITNAVLTQSSHELSRLYDLMSAGDDVASSSRRIAQSLHDVRNPTPRERDGAIAMHVLSLAASIGGRVADQIGSLVDLLDDRMSVRRERRAQAASAAASMKLLTWLPSVCGIWILLDSASVRTFLIGSITGWTCLVLGVFLNLAGRVWMQRLVASC